MENIDKELSKKLNLLRGLVGIEIFHRENLKNRLGIKENVFVELVKHNLVIKVRNGRSYTYTLRKDFITEKDVAKALFNLREKSKNYYHAHKQVVIPEKVDLTVEKAIEFLKDRGYLIAKIC